MDSLSETIEELIRAGYKPGISYFDANRLWRATLHADLKLALIAEVDKNA